MKPRQIWMLATAPAGKGGIASVLRQYEQEGMFDNGAVRLLETHHDRNALGRVLPFLKACAVLWWALLLGRVAVIHAHVSHGGSFWRKFLLTAPALAGGVPVLSHLHSGSFEDFHERASPFTQGCIRWMLGRSLRVITLSAARAQWVHRVQPLAQTEVVLNSAAAPATVQPLQDPPTVLFLGRIGPNKGTFDLLQAFATIHRDRPDCRLVVGGDGEAEKLVELVRALGLQDAVHYCGWVDAAQKARLLDAAWVFALPSYHEGLPMAILEAMAHGRAVVSCPIGGIPEAVEADVTGLMVPPGDLARLVDALRRILGDSGYAARLGAAGRASFAARFSNEANLPKLVALYKAAGAATLPRLKAAN
ncbi:glycosyltransferase family 4 protein [Pelomonas sp. KK5]|uniref:glycosyltransferase family 4 protein n=1 Tax=Pelomonas sp. KK5 TaxID=1855730 RepID=UPI00097C14A7|nr:glycosyltransferase family 4 protein [Pelomonas sp. KK5]